MKRKSIMAMKTGESMYDDGQESKAFKAAFQSTVYATYEEYMSDIHLMSKNETFKFALAHETESAFPRRSPEERQQILIQKVHAQRRYQEHLETGGTDFDTDDDSDGDIDDFLSELLNKKARH
ncbi:MULTISPECIES: hypothetical protein [Vibrio harveyi group]|uniref:hypothetical protein n=1 Tax=Vibrio harveyi group TaxID=717610 RepID=UPI0015DFF9D2|nr:MULTISPECIES: hypothetical protein [Vibrio harveyi group]EHR5479635.1 hypothetical protein [Vibrio parahaemolyticus]MCR9728008.1 hypothetical protein [Vibrio parahaemolyticus]MCR9750560.1 hypothetical protein [Vibrio parahaemolyticus]MCR9785278.1 hypothetical protein [Vibrio parahaemolyticus]MCR9860739.1 hypothetical protein [Vibrio parahaemolyticus]